MALILTPLQLQANISIKNASYASPLPVKLGSQSLKPVGNRASVRTSTNFRVFTVKAVNGTINRMEDLLNLDVTPYTDRVIAEYIW